MFLTAYVGVQFVPYATASFVHAYIGGFACDTIKIMDV